VSQSLTSAACELSQELVELAWLEHLETRHAWHGSTEVKLLEAWDLPEDDLAFFVGVARTTSVHLTSVFYTSVEPDVEGTVSSCNLALLIAVHVGHTASTLLFLNFYCVPMAMIDKRVIVALVAMFVIIHDLRLLYVQAINPCWTKVHQMSFRIWLAIFINAAVAKIKMRKFVFAVPLGLEII
jgi:hypothetical protein